MKRHTATSLLGVLAGCVALALLAGGCRPAPPSPPAPPTAVVTAPPVSPSIAELRALFDYDPQAPLDVQEDEVTYRGEVAIHELTYASPMGGRVPAYLVVPPGEGPFAGVLFHHPGGGNRRSFLDEAVDLAGEGVVSLLINAPGARPAPWQRNAEYTPEDRALYVQNVVDMRRGVDLLLSRPEVDPGRLGFIGHSYGAHMGGVLSGVEDRIDAYVFMAGLPHLSERIPPHIASVLPEEDLAAYLEAVAPVDAVHYVAHAEPAALLFQAARHDEIIPQATAMEFYEAASRPKELVWYDTGHSLDEQARSDRTRWLMERIGE